MKYILKLSFAFLLIHSACSENGTNIQLDIRSESAFSGTFETINSESISGEVYLKIINGRYECSTSQPFGHGAGTLLIDEHSINFVDTLFFVIPANYGPSYVLSGEHKYSFDGQKLEIWKSINVGKIQYELQIEDSPYP